MTDCTEAEGTYPIESIQALHSENGIKSIVLGKGNKRVFLSSSVDYDGQSLEMVDHNNDKLTTSWKDYRLIGFRYATDSEKKVIKSLQLLGINAHVQKNACVSHANKLTFLIVIPVLVLLELIILGALLAKYVIFVPKPDDAPEDLGSYPEKLIKNINEARKVEVHEAIAFTSVINFLFVLGLLYFMFDMTFKAE